MTADRVPSERVTAVQARLFKALGHPTRLAIVRALADGERDVKSIHRAVGSDLSTVSRHLAQLLAAGVLSSRRDGRRVFYRLRTGCVLTVMRCVTAMLTEETDGPACVSPDSCAGCPAPAADGGDTR